MLVKWKSSSSSRRHSQNDIIMIMILTLSIDLPCNWTMQQFSSSPKLAELAFTKP
jgi:hypothetical protein